MRRPALVRKAAAVLATAKRPRAWRLDVVKELVADLQTATVPGRRFTLEKILKILEEETAAAAPDLSAFQRRALARALAELRRERARPSPRVDACVSRVETMLWTLA